MKNIALVFLASSLISAPSLAVSDAPFGLTWGMSNEEFTNLGITLSPTDTPPGTVGYQTSELPKNLSNAEFYNILLDESYGLQKVLMASDTISDDAYGIDGKEAYANLKSSLTEKYGSPDEAFEYVGRTLWTEPDEFYQCLSYDGCGTWISFFNDKESGQTIMLKLKGLRRGEGYLSLSYEGPKFGDVIDRIEAQRAASDSGAL